MRKTESGRSILETTLVIAIIVLLVAGTVTVWNVFKEKNQVRSLEERLVALRSERQTNIIPNLRKRLKRTEDGPFETQIEMENGIGDVNNDYFWIVVTTPTVSLCNALESVDSGTLKSSKIENSCAEEKAITFYFKKFDKAVGEPDKTKQPTDCPLNAVCNEYLEVVSCKDGYYLYQGECLQCPENYSICSGINFSCGEGKYHDKASNSCLACNNNAIKCDESGNPLECGNDYFMKRDTQECVRCPEIGLQLCDTYTFICEDGYFKSGDICDYCGDGISKCDIDGSPLECKENYYIITANGVTTCEQCPTVGVSQCDTDGFICQEGFYKKNNSCISCGTGTESCDINGAPLKCKDGYYLKTVNNTKQCNQCPTEGVDSCTTNDFSCKIGYIKDSNNGSCNCKTNGQLGNECSELCSNSCAVGFCSNNKCVQETCRKTGDINTNILITCDAGQVCLENGSCASACPSGYNSDGYCCPEGQKWDSENKICTNCLQGAACGCPQDTPISDGNGNCIANCPENSSRTVIEGKQIGTTGCYCKEGYQVHEDGCLSVCLGGAEYTTVENAKGEATNLENCYCPENKPYWNLGSEECTETQVTDCTGTLTDDGACCPTYRVYQSGEENLCCNLTCESNSQVLDIQTCSCLGCTGEGCCPTGSILCNLQCCDIGAACNTTSHQCCEIGEVVLNGFCCPFGTTAATSNGCCEPGQKVINNLCCDVDDLDTTTVNPERTAYTCCDGVTFDWTGYINWISSYRETYKICCSEGSGGYAYNDKKCCGEGETVVDGHCCPAGSTHYAPDADGKYICCSDDLYSDYEKKCTDGVERWVVISECSKLKISCPRTSKRACGLDCCEGDENYCNLDVDTGLYYCCKDRHEEITQCESNL